MAGASAAGDSSPKGHDNENVEDIWVNLNKSRNDNQSELMQTIKDLKEELQNVKKDNERILKAHEELNNILLNKIHSKVANLHKGPEAEEIGIASYKRKTKKLEFA